MQNTSDIQKLIDRRQTLYKSISELKDQIEHIKDEIKKTDTKLYNLCVHQWDCHDTGGAYSERYYICKICSLYQ